MSEMPVELSGAVEPTFGRSMGDFVSDTGYYQTEDGVWHAVEGPAEKQMLELAVAEVDKRQGRDVDPTDLRQKVLSMASHVKECEFQVERVREAQAGLESQKHWLERRMRWLKSVMISMVRVTGSIPVRESMGWGLGVSTRLTLGVDVTDPKKVDSARMRLTFRGRGNQFTPKALAWLRSNVEELEPEPMRAELLKDFRADGVIPAGCEIRERESLVISSPRHSSGPKES